MMKIGEALTRRAALQTQVGELRTRLEESVLVQEGESPAEEPSTLLERLDTVVDELERLVVAINATNVLVRLADGRTIMEAIARREALARKHGTLTRAADAANVSQNRYLRSELKLERKVEVADLRTRADELARERRELDAQIQAANWTHDLVEEVGA
jgi:hypothetical protein